MAQPASMVGGKFSCAACGRQYGWKPQLAGKKAKCACGAAVVVPQGPPASASPPAAPSPAPSRASSPAPAPAPVPDDDLYDFAAAPAVSPTRVAAPAAEPARSTAAPPSVGGGKVMVVPQPVATPYLAGGRAPDGPRDRTAEIDDVRRDLLLPLGLIAAGFVGMLAWALTAADAGAAGAVVVSLAVGLSTLVKTFVIILLALVAAPMFGVSFGPLRTAVAKFAAVIIFTDMGLLWLDEIVDAVAGEATGRGARRGTWLVTLLFATALVSFLVRFLFDMDSEEVGYVAAPLVIASLVIGFFLKLVAVGVLMGIAGAGDGGSDGASPGPAPPAASVPSDAPAAEDADTPADGAAPDATPGTAPADAADAAVQAEAPIQYRETPQDREIARKARTPALMEARSWVEHRAARRDDARGDLIAALYEAGARKVRFDLTSGANPTRGYVELPAYDSARKRCVRAYRAYCRAQGIRPDPQALEDTGQRFLVVEMRR